MADGPQAQRITGVHRRFVAFCGDVGLDISTAGPVDPDLIEAFVGRGLPGRRSSTKGTYRSVLTRTLPKAERPSVRGAPFPGSWASAPYTGSERTALVAMASAQRKEWMRRAALCVLAGGIGAGLHPRELIALRGRHLGVVGGDVVATVSGPRPRLVPVVPAWGSVLLALAQQAGDGFVFHPEPADRTYKNFVNNVCRRLVGDPDLVRLSAGRGRSSFICDHLVAGTPLSELLAFTGIDEVESLARYARHVPGTSTSKATLRRVLVDEGRR